jgi:type IV pilus assembly protein PilA
MKIMKKGFTLIELIVVIAIIAILALILVPQVTGYIADANESAEKASAKTCYTTAVAIWTFAEAELTSGTVTLGTGCTVDYAGDSSINSATYGDWTYDGSGFSN